MTAVEGQHSHNIQDQFGSHDPAEALCQTPFGQSGFVVRRRITVTIFHSSSVFAQGQNPIWS